MMVYVMRICTTGTTHTMLPYYRPAIFEMTYSYLEINPLVPFYGDNPLLLGLDILRKLMEGCTVIVGDIICAPVSRTTRYTTVRHFEKAAISSGCLAMDPVMANS